MSAKLRKYYAKMDDTFVYGDSAILHPRGKTIFTQDSWEKELADKCIQGCREWFIKNYQARSGTDSTTVSTTNLPPSGSRKHPLKRKIAEMMEEKDEDSEEDDFYARAQHIAAGRQRTQSENQFDRYYHSLIIVHQNETALSWWKRNEPNYRDLALMFRDVMTVPPTGWTGVQQIGPSSHMDAKQIECRNNKWNHV
jgi:hypothetical protein